MAVLGAVAVDSADDEALEVDSMQKIYELAGVAAVDVADVAVDVAVAAAAGASFVLEQCRSSSALLHGAGETPVWVHQRSCLVLITQSLVPLQFCLRRRPPLLVIETGLVGLSE